MTEAPEATDDELPGEELEEDEEAREEDALAERALTTDDRQLPLAQAEDLAGEGVLDVVLLVGEPETGKTTLLVALWDALLAQGAIGTAMLAGSRTALGFERRAWLSRLLSNGERRDTLRTYQEDNGFVHLRLLADAEIHEVLLSDIAGETFRQVREGASFSDKLPWLGRADSALLCVDGASLADGARRSTALTNARVLLRQLTLARGDRGLRLAIVLTMADLVTDNVRRRWNDGRESLMSLARELDVDAVALETSARADPPLGLEELVSWILEEPRIETPISTPGKRPSRVSARTVSGGKP